MARKKEWFERFFDATYGKVLAGTFDEARTLEQARLVKRLLGLRRGARVLDVPCGHARLTIPLAEMGLAMTGVDLAAGYLRRGRREAHRRGLKVRFLCRDMREIDFDGEFDAAFNFFGSIGYFADAENLLFCRRVLAALRPGGRFLVEGLNKSWLLRHFKPHQEQAFAGIRVTHRSRWLRRSGRVESDWTFHLPGGPRRRRISMRVYDGSEMRAMLRAAGFGDIRLHGWPPLGRFSRHSRRFLAVARRPRS
jgi:SAM-dependent methyltransferase